MEEMIQKIKAVMIGHAVGDALGVPVEFCEREELVDNPVTSMRGYGTYDVPAGAWSDDTSMSLAALDSLADGKENYFEIMVNFVKWLESSEYTPTGETFDVGRTCMRSILRFVGACRSPETEDFVCPEDFDPSSFGGDGEYANGNGSLMRIHPFVLKTWFDCLPMSRFEHVIRGASSMTHAHERSVLACKIYAFVLFLILHTPSKSSVVRGLWQAKVKYRHDPEFVHFKRLFAKNFSKLPADEIKSSGYVVDTLEAAVWCLLNTSDYESAVLKAVNLGGDTDTIAAITGGLAGALYGYDAIPEEWRNTLLRRDYIEEMCERARRNWSRGVGEVLN